MRQTQFLFGIHCHQPEGNFPEVIKDACERSYLPFLEVAQEFPDFHFSAHFSGGLLEWIADNQPRIISLLRTMCARGQLEMVGGGDHEPVLAVIPMRDRIGQLRALRKRIKKTCGTKTNGSWLTERVWESTVIPALVQAKMKYVLVDDYHFLCAGMSQKDLGGYYRSEEDGYYCDIFPISEALRYRLPFSPAHEAVEYLESLACEDGHAAICFDDGEKFGVWPETYDWVYNKGWLRDFFQRVCDSQLVETLTYSEYRSEYSIKGLCYLPTTSYSEMGEWSLQANASECYSHIAKSVQEHRNNWDQDKAFVRGGIWKNFLVKYPESGWMHKRMLGLSKRVDSLSLAKKESQKLHDLLYRAQANDAYWHGLFGGLYHPHLRRAIYRNLIQLEAALDAQTQNSKNARPAFEKYDLDLDGSDEYLLHDNQQQIIVNPKHGSILEWDRYDVSHNLADVLRRHYEHYHTQIAQGANQHEYHGDGIASIHDRVDFIHEITNDDLVSDEIPRTLANDLIKINGVCQTNNNYIVDNVSDNSLHLYCDLSHGRLHKSYTIEKDGILRVSYQINSNENMKFSLCSQYNLAMPSCDGSAGSVYRQGEIIGGFGSSYNLNNCNALLLSDAVLEASVSLQTSVPAQWNMQPLHTVSRSEAGFEKIMQAFVVDIVFDECQLDVGDSWQVEISLNLCEI
ncbi:MAG: alpha-amylase/4-alpha-glucanotransferase domain-containing protein [Mariprofundales bacterium]